MKWINLMPIILLFVMIFGGCEGDDNPISSGTVNLTIKNELALWSIHHVYVSPSGSNQWGNDLLDRGSLSPGRSTTLELSKGTYDIKVVDEDGDEYLKREIKLDRNYTWTVEITDLSVDSLFE